MSVNLKRRKVCQSAGSVIMLLPIMAVCGSAAAKTNSSLREKLKYQSNPKGEQSCATCLEFVPDASDPTRGLCKVIPDDDEISVHGYCVAWNTM